MKIAFITPEVYPYASTGGLADVSHALPEALAEKGHDVIIIMPGYSIIDKEKFNLRLEKPGLPVPFQDGEKMAAVFSARHNPRVTAYFIDYPPFFARDGLYNTGSGDYPDNAERFAFFCRAAMESLKAVGFSPDVIHCNDWQTGLIPVYLKTLYRNDRFFSGVSAVMTIHNAGYQGEFSPDKYFCTGLLNTDFNIEDLQSDGRLNYLKGGVLYADAVTTVSRKYAAEIQTAEYGHNLADVFKRVNSRLYGILNGIDDKLWDPSKDVFLPAKYTSEDTAGKKICKRELQKRAGFKIDENIPLMGSVARLSHQKGMDILADTIECLFQDEIFQFVILGSGEEWIYKKYERIGGMFPGRLFFYYGYEEELAHLVQAGMDIFVMPSRYEPCGLSVMYSLMYGTVPVARSTGGLIDIIENWNSESRSGNGFMFNNLNIEELYNVIRKAVRIYRAKSDWDTIIKNAMGFNFTWADAVKEYEAVYIAAGNAHHNGLLG